MLVVLEKTYRGLHGLLIAGHPYDLTEKQLADIADELARTKQEFKFRQVKNPNRVNRPTKTLTIKPRQDYRGKEGVFEKDKTYTLPVRKVDAIEADCKSQKGKFEYDVVEPSDKQQDTEADKQ